MKTGLFALAIVTMLAQTAAADGGAAGLIPCRLQGQWGDDWSGGGDEGGGYGGGGGGSDFGKKGMFGIVIRAGLLLTNYWGEDWEDVVGDDYGDPYKLGPAVEVAFAVNPIKYVSFQLGWAYAMKGTWLDYENAWFEYEMQTMFHYFEFPLLAIARIPTGTVVTPRVFGGMNFGFFLGGTWETETKVKATGATSDADDDLEDIEAFDFGFVVGAGAEIKVNPNVFVLAEIRYDFSITEFYEDDAATTMDDFKHEYLCFSIGVGFTF